MKKISASVSHHEFEVAELRADRELSVRYLKAALKALDDPDSRDAGLLALRAIDEAHDGLADLTAEAGIGSEAMDKACLHMNLERQLAFYDRKRFGGEAMVTDGAVGQEFGRRAARNQQAGGYEK